jgi:hypothetical protein
VSYGISRAGVKGYDLTLNPNPVNRVHFVTSELGGGAGVQVEQQQRPTGCGIGRAAEVSQQPEGGHCYINMFGERGEMCSAGR